MGGSSIMTETLITAVSTIIVGVLSLLGVVITNNRYNNKLQINMKTAQAVTDEKISELTREVRAHNGFAEKIPVIEEKIKNINDRIEDLESYHKHT